MKMDFIKSPLARLQRSMLNVYNNKMEIDMKKKKMKTFNFF